MISCHVNHSVTVPAINSPMQIDQALVGEEDELLTIASIKIMARFPTP